MGNKQNKGGGSSKIPYTDRQKYSSNLKIDDSKNKGRNSLNKRLMEKIECPFCSKFFDPETNYSIFNSHLKICGMDFMEKKNNHIVKEKEKKIIKVNNVPYGNEKEDRELNKKILESFKRYKVNTSIQGKRETKHFNDKIKELKAEISKKKVKWQDGYCQLDLNRANFLEESVTKIGKIDLFKELHINFIGEVSYDAGGIIREWFTTCFKEMEKESMGLFKVSEGNDFSYGLNPLLPRTESSFRYFFFIGKLLGKALLDNITINVCFNKLIYKMILEEKIEFEDLIFIDSPLYHSLKNLKDLIIQEKVMKLAGLDKVCNERKKDNEDLGNLETEGGNDAEDGDVEMENVNNKNENETINEKEKINENNNNNDNGNNNNNNDNGNNNNNENVNGSDNNNNENDDNINIKGECVNIWSEFEEEGNITNSKTNINDTKDNHMIIDNVENIDNINNIDNRNRKDNPDNIDNIINNNINNEPIITNNIDNSKTLNNQSTSGNAIPSKKNTEKNKTPPSEESVLDSCDLYYSVEIADINGYIHTFDLKPNGRNSKVADINEYIQSRIYFMIGQYEPFIAKIREGLFKIISKEKIQVFNSDELELLINGRPFIDVEEWRENSVYKTPYTAGHKVIKWFWEVLGQMTQKELSNFLLFCTGSSRVPLDGFVALESNRGNIAKFTVEPVPYKKKEKNFIKAHTCFNRIDLPQFTSKEEVKEALEYCSKTEIFGFGID